MNSIGITRYEMRPVPGVVGSVEHVICGACGHAEPQSGHDHRYCRECGNALMEKVCECGSMIRHDDLLEIRPSSRFCSDCGAPVDYAELARSIRSREGI
jgi:predicted amidophosphoribosyltransferase